MRLRSEWDREIFPLAVPAFGALIAEPVYVLSDTATASQTPCTAWWVASRWSPAPNNRATAAVVP